MGKKSRNRTKAAAPASTEGEVGPRQPCPCGSGRRYKACHGAAGGPATSFVRRPFAGVPDEVDLVAVREFVSCATAPIRLKDSDREVVLCSLLPGALPALVRENGAIWLGLQVRHAFGDPSRDLGAVLEKALAADPGEMIGLTSDPGQGPRLQDFLADDPIEFTIHDGFEFWLGENADDEAMQEALHQANDSAAPTVRIEPGAYWTRMGEREYLRWVLPHDEDPLLDALARIHVAGEDHLVPGDRLIGTFRAHGLLAPVWEFDHGTGPESLATQVSALGSAIRDSIDSANPLSTEERAARSGLASRQVTIR